MTPDTKLWLRGRYQTWAIIVEDIRVETPDGPRYRCRSCDATCPRANMKWCSPDCRRIWATAIEAPLDPDHLRNLCLARDRRVCQGCSYDDLDPSHPAIGEPDWTHAYRALEVDHVRPVKTYPEAEFDLDNLRTLCRPCHARIGARPRSLDPAGVTRPITTWAPKVPLGTPPIPGGGA